jgi:hypothetical protein
MAFTDPISITVNAVAKSMPRVSTTTGNNQRASLYQMSDRTFSLEISHRDVLRNKRSRHIGRVTFTQRANVSNPLDTTLIPDLVSWSFQVDHPLDGFTSTQMTDMLTGLKTWYDTTVAGKIIGGES